MGTVPVETLKAGNTKFKSGWSLLGKSLALHLTQISRNRGGCDHRVLIPLPLSLHISAAKAGRKHFYVKQRSCADVNSTYKRKC